MADFVYTGEKYRWMRGERAFQTDDIRVLLFGTSSTADADQDSANIADFTTLDEFTDASYSRQALDGESVAQDDPNNRAEFDATDEVFTALDGDTADGIVVFQYVDGTAANDETIACIQSGGFPITANGGNLTIQWNTEGVIQLT